MNKTDKNEIKKDLAYWIEIGKKMTEERQERIQAAKKRKFDTIATHGTYDLNQALSLNSGSIMEPAYLTPAQAYHNSAEMEAGLSYQMPTWCYSRIANPSNYYLEETIKYSPECEDDPSGHVFKDLNESFTAQWKGKIIVGEITDLNKRNFHQLYEESYL